MIIFMKSACSSKISKSAVADVLSHPKRAVENTKKEENGPGTLLTVWRKSLVFTCSGFTVIDSKGDLVYRVDNYSGRPAQIVLMDPTGKSVLTMHRHKGLSLLNQWLVYEGEADEPTKKSQKKKPIYRVKKHMKILQTNNSSVLAHVFKGSADNIPAYVIEGSYGQRSCTVLDSTRTIVAEIRRKEPGNQCVSFGLEVFDLIVRPGFDAGLAMVIVLLLDQMFR